MISRLRRAAKLLGLSAVTSIQAIRALRKTEFEPLIPVSDTDSISFVIYSIIPWEGVWQRPQHFATRLSEKYNVLYVDPMGLQHVVASGTQPPERIIRVHEKLTVFRPHVLPGGKTRSFITRLNDAIVLESMHKLLTELKFSRPVLVTNTPLADKIAGAYPWRTVAYDVIDDFISTSWAPPDAGVREQKLFKAADTVFTGTYSLYRKKQPFHSEIEFIPCGVEVDHFIRATHPETVIPRDITGLPHPIMGYFGGLNERLDSEILVRLAKAFPDGSVVLIGPVFADFGLSDFQDQWTSVLPGPESPGFRLKSIPENLYILGIRPYQTLPEYLKAFDVCLLPYVLNQVTQDIHPVKILEYLAAGKPVVSTPLPDVTHFYRDIIVIAESPDDFIPAVRQALTAPDNADKRISFARSRTWEAMTARMEERILAHVR